MENSISSILGAEGGCWNNLHMIGQSIGENHDGGSLSICVTAVEQLDAFQEPMPEISSISRHQGLDVVPGQLLIGLRHGEKLLHHLGLAPKSDDAQPIMVVHGLDDGAGGVLGQVEDGKAGVLAGVFAWNRRRGPHAAGDVDDQDDVAGDMRHVSGGGFGSLHSDEHGIFVWNRFYLESGNLMLLVVCCCWCCHNRSLAIIAEDGNSLRFTTSATKACFSCL